MKKSNNKIKKLPTPVELLPGFQRSHVRLDPVFRPKTTGDHCRTCERVPLGSKVPEDKQEGPWAQEDGPQLEVKGALHVFFLPRGL